VNKKQILNKRAKLLELIKDKPGITSPELAEQVGFDSSSKVTTALWQRVRSGQIVTERVVRDGYNVNAHYMADQVPPDAVERINQKRVDASEVIPMVKSADARNSVFDVPKPTKQKSQPKAEVTSSRQTTARSPGFACALTSDGSLVLIREGQIEFSLSGAEAATLQSYLVKRAAANLFASMA
jgi:hypothetical protein